MGCTAKSAVVVVSSAPSDVLQTALSVIDIAIGAPPWFRQISPTSDHLQSGPHRSWTSSMDTQESIDYVGTDCVYLRLETSPICPALSSIGHHDSGSPLRWFRLFTAHLVVTKANLPRDFRRSKPHQRKDKATLTVQYPITKGGGPQNQASVGNGLLYITPGKTWSAWQLPGILSTIR